MAAGPRAYGFFSNRWIIAALIVSASAQAIIIRQSRLTGPLAVIAGQERVGFGMVRIAGQDSLGPAQTVCVAAVGEHPCGDLDAERIVIGVSHQVAA